MRPDPRPIEMDRRPNEPLSALIWRCFHLFVQTLHSGNSAFVYWASVESLCDSESLSVKSLDTDIFDDNAIYSSN